MKTCCRQSVEEVLDWAKTFMDKLPPSSGGSIRAYDRWRVGYVELRKKYLSDESSHEEKQ